MGLQDLGHCKCKRRIDNKEKQRRRNSLGGGNGLGVIVGTAIDFFGIPLGTTETTLHQTAMTFILV